MEDSCSLASFLCRSQISARLKGSCKNYDM